MTTTNRIEIVQMPDDSGASTTSQLITEIANNVGYIRTKAKSMGLSVTDSSKLSEIVKAIQGIVDKGSDAISITTANYSLAAGYYHGNTVTGHDADGAISETQATGALTTGCNVKVPAGYYSNDVTVRIDNESVYNALAAI